MLVPYLSRDNSDLASSLYFLRSIHPSLKTCHCLGARVPCQHGELWLSCRAGGCRMVCKGCGLAAEGFCKSDVANLILYIPHSEISGLLHLSGCISVGERSISAMLPAKQSGGSTFGDRLPKPCLSCPFGLMKDRAVYPSLPTPWDAEQAGTR